MYNQTAQYGFMMFSLYEFVWSHRLFSHNTWSVGVEQTNKWDLLHLVKNITILVGGYI